MKSFIGFKAYTSIGFYVWFFVFMAFLGLFWKKKLYIIQYKCHYFKEYNFLKIIFMFRFYLKMSLCINLFYEWIWGTHENIWM